MRADTGSPEHRGGRQSPRWPGERTRNPSNWPAGGSHSSETESTTAPRGTLPKSREELVEGATSGPRATQRDAPVCLVRHPAARPRRRRLAEDEVAEADPLDPAPDDGLERAVPSAGSPGSPRGSTSLRRRAARGRQAMTRSSTSSSGPTFTSSSSPARGEAAKESGSRAESSRCGRR